VKKAVTQVNAKTTETGMVHTRFQALTDVATAQMRLGLRMPLR